MEDNNLWLRHLLNLVLQVVLSLYVFWKSIRRHSVELLVSGIFVFIAGLSNMEKGHGLSSVGALKVFRAPLEITVSINFQN
jgi:hypothetical protein